MIGREKCILKNEGRKETNNNASNTQDKKNVAHKFTPRRIVQGTFTNL